MQFVHLSYIKISTISKQSKLSFHLSPFTQDYHCLSDQAALTNSFDSCRPTCVITHEQLGTSLTITSTPTGRFVKLKTAQD